MVKSVPKEFGVHLITSAIVICSIPRGPTAELSAGTSLQNAKGVHCRRCDMRSSDLMGGEVFTYYVLLPFIADQQRAG